MGGSKKGGGGNQQKPQPLLFDYAAKARQQAQQVQQAQQAQQAQFEAQQRAQQDQIAAQQRALAEAQERARQEEIRKQQQAEYNSAVDNAQTLSAQGSSLATQQLSTANQAQQAKDVGSLQAQQSSAAAGGQSAIGGGGFNPAAATKMGIANIGAGGGSAQLTPATNAPAGQAAAQAQTVNQTGVTSNKFVLPSNQGITFGGS